MASIFPKDEKARDLIFNALKSALAYAKFSEPEIRKLINKLISVMEHDLGDCVWSPMPVTEEEASRLQEFINMLERDDDAKERPEIISTASSSKIDEESEPLEMDIIISHEQIDDDLPDVQR